MPVIIFPIFRSDGILLLSVKKLIRSMSKSKFLSFAYLMNDFVILVLYLFSLFLDSLTSISLSLVVLFGRQGIVKL